MKIFLNFSNPALVSTGLSFDVLSLKVLNGSNFTLENERIPMLDGYIST
jgi:hypothetical protein